MKPAAYITTPIYYVNDVPHIGHAYTTIAADVLARTYRLFGSKALFLTGTDEHGQKIETAANKAGVEPQAFVDKVSKHFSDMGKVINLSEHQFIRTTESRHKKAAQALWQKLVENDQIYKSKYEGWYSVRDETFFTESELVDGKAPTGSDVEWVEEPSYFFKLSQWQEPLLRFYEANPTFIQPNSRRNEVISFVKGGLRDLSISRSTFAWGIPVPEDPQHVMYVWVEALTNYLTAIGYPNIDGADFKQFWPEAIHLVGKDILRHHAVYWPALLMAADLPPPKRIFAHGWWTIEGEKMSKSVGNTIDPIALVDQYGSDQLRYFLMREVPFGKDGDFAQQALVQRINSDLANDLGNLSQRVLSFIQKNAEAQVPEQGDLTEADTVILDKAKALPEQVYAAAENQALNKICELIWQVVGGANRYIDAQKPWDLRKSDTARMQTVLHTLLDVIRHVAVMVSPVVPDAAAKILDQLAIPADKRDVASLSDWQLMAGTDLPKPEPVFPRI